MQVVLGSNTARRVHILLQPYSNLAGYVGGDWNESYPLDPGAYMDLSPFARRLVSSRRGPVSGLAASLPAPEREAWQIRLRAARKKIPVSAWAANCSKNFRVRLAVNAPS